MRTVRSILLVGFSAMVAAGCQNSIGISSGGETQVRPGEVPPGGGGPASGGASVPSSDAARGSGGASGTDASAGTGASGALGGVPPALTPAPLSPPDPAGAGPGTPIEEAARKQRLEEGVAHYTSKSCVVCHGNDGRKTVGNGKSLLNCDACDSWEHLRDVIDKTMPPAAGPDFGPQSCDADCAARTADWIWYTVNGFRLTEMGGTRPEKIALAAGQDTLRIKPYAALKADFLRVFGKVPATLEGSAGAFKAVPKLWYENASLGAVTLNVLANAAVEACASETMPALEPDAVRGKCGEWARRMWLRDGSAAELQSCVDTALVTTKTLNPARKRLDFACASMMLSMPALTF